VVANAGLRHPVLVAAESVPMRANAILSLRLGWPAIHHALLLRTGHDLRTRTREFVDAQLVRRSGTTVLGCSRGVVEHWTERLGVPWEQVIYMPNWVDAERFAPAGAVSELPALPRLTCVAAFRPIKLQHVLIDAAGILKRRGQRVRVTFVGGADRPEQRPYLASCRQQAEQLGLSEDIEFLGRRDDILEILRSSTAFVFPSRQEGLACAMLEAMAVGLPVIASAIHASYEVIRHGENGFLVRAEDPVELADTIHSVITLTPESRRSISGAARDTVLRGYTLDRATELAVEPLRRRSIHV
jgi:glycosyltransferase involved in cell wall biosynthesis